MKRLNGKNIVVTGGTSGIGKASAIKLTENVCGIRSEFNIAHGFGYGAKGHGARESLAFGGDAKDSTFYKNFIANPNIFYDILCKMRLTILLKNHENKLISGLIKTAQ